MLHADNLTKGACKIDRLKMFFQNAADAETWIGPQPPDTDAVTAAAAAVAVGKV